MERDIMHSIKEFLQSLQIFKSSKISAKLLSDGVVFCQLLSYADSSIFTDQQMIKIKQNCKQIEINEKVRNMKKLLKQIGQYFERQQTGIKYGDIDLVYIAKNNSIRQIGKFMELVLSVLVKCQNKDYYINTIMSLSKQTQQIFASLIQNGLTQRICKIQQTYSNQMIEQFQRIQLQNQTLYQQIQKLITQNEILEAQVKKYEDQLQQQSFFQKKQSIIDQSLDDIQSRNNQYTSAIINNLKQKIYSITAEHQQQIFDLNQQIQKLKQKIKDSSHLQEMLILYRQKYEECLQYMDKVTLWQKQKNKFSDSLLEKNIIIEKLQEQILILNEQNVNLQQQELQLQLTLQKTRSKLKEYQFNSFKVKQQNIRNSKQNQKCLQQLKSEKNKYKVFVEKLQLSEQIQLLTLDNKRLQRKFKQFQKENQRIKNKLQKLKTIEQDKNALQKLIIDLHTKKNAETQLLVNCLYQTNKEYSYLFKTFIK